MRKMIMLFAILATFPIVANAACLDSSTIDIGNHVYIVDNGNTTLNMTQMIKDMESLCNNQALIASILDAMNIRISSLQNQTYGNYTWFQSSISNMTSSISNTNYSTSALIGNVSMTYWNLSTRVSSLEQSTIPSVSDIAALNASVIYINAINAAQTANITNLTSTVNALPDQEDNTLWFMIGLGGVMLSVIGLFAYMMVNKGGSESSG